VILQKITNDRFDAANLIARPADHGRPQPLADGTVGHRRVTIGRLAVGAEIDLAVDKCVVRAMGGQKSLRRPVGNVDGPFQESKRVLRGVRARIACPVS
jgi:hypothetical protein